MPDSNHDLTAEISAFLASIRFTDKRVMMQAVVDHWPDLPITALLSACSTASQDKRSGLFREQKRASWDMSPARPR